MGGGGGRGRGAEGRGDAGTRSAWVAGAGRARGRTCRRGSRRDGGGVAELGARVCFFLVFALLFFGRGITYRLTECAAFYLPICMGGARFYSFAFQWVRKSINTSKGLGAHRRRPVEPKPARSNTKYNRGEKGCALDVGFGWCQGLLTGQGAKGGAVHFNRRRSSPETFPMESECASATRPENPTIAISHKRSVRHQF